MTPTWFSEIEKGDSTWWGPAADGKFLLVVLTKARVPKSKIIKQKNFVLLIRP